jgi:hypothetical protein
VSAVVRSLELSGRLRTALVVYGILVAVVGTAGWALFFPDGHVALESSRQAAITQSIAVIDSGGPPLVVKANGGYVPANEGDDQGIYLVLGELGHLTGGHDALTLFKDFSAGAMGVVVALAPIGALALFDSVLLAVLAPLGVLASFQFLVNRDVYFANAWIVLFGLPIAWLVAERRFSWPRATILLGVAALAASCCNAIRSHSGTGVGIALAAAAVLASDAWKRRVVAVLIVAACYAAVSPVTMSIVQRHAFAEAHIPSGATTTSHSLWHPTYLGLGYLPNAWGIRWEDSVGAETVRRVDPSVAYLSPRYEQILRHKYFTIVEHHPFWVARLYAVKAAALIWAAVKEGGLLALLLPAALLIGRHRARLRLRLLLLVPAVVFAAIPPLLAIPTGYDSGLIACLDLAGAAALADLLGVERAELRPRVAAASGLVVGVVIASAVTTAIFASQVAGQIGG